MALLKFLQQPHTAEEVAAEMDRPLYWVRMSLRELVAAGLVAADAGGYRASEQARARTRTA